MPEKVGVFIEAETSRVLKELSENEFGLEIENHESQEINLKMHFIDADSISTSFEKDELIVRVLQPEVFKSQDDGEALVDTDSRAVKSIPPQIDEKTGENMKALTDTGGKAV